MIEVLVVEGGADGVYVACSDQLKAWAYDCWEVVGRLRQKGLVCGGVVGEMEAKGGVGRWAWRRCALGSDEKQWYALPR